ncbi:MAG: hypothetical protein R2769_11960 [Saprospiraceae bacterium]
MLNTQLNILFSHRISNSKITFYKIRQQAGIVTLKVAISELATVTVVGRRDEKPQEIPYKVGTIDSKLSF